MQFLEGVHFHWSLCEAANALSKVVVLVEGFNVYLLPSALLFHFFQNFLVPELAEEAVTGSKDRNATFVEGHEHLFEKFVVHVVVVDESCAGDDVKFVFKFLRECIGLTQVMLLQCGVDTFLSCLIQHAHADVEAFNLLEPMLHQTFSDQACSTSEVKDFNVRRILRFGKLLNCVSNLLGIRISNALVNTVVVRGKVVVVLLNVVGSVLVALFNFFDVSLTKFGHIPIEGFSGNRISANAAGGLGV